MQVNLTQEEIREVLEALPEDSTIRDRFYKLSRESSTLRVLSETGLMGAVNSKQAERFSQWQNMNKKVYASEEDAKEAEPECFKKVCTEWGRAGYIYNEFLLTDGRTVICQGNTWDVPEPGGSKTVYYFKQDR